MDEHDERRAGQGRRLDDVERDVALEAAREAARRVVDAGIVELTDEVKALRSALTTYAGNLEKKLRRRSRAFAIAIVIGALLLIGLAVTMYAVRAESVARRAQLRAGILHACERTKGLETAIIGVLGGGIANRRPGETALEYRYRREAVQAIIEGITSPPCSDPIGGEDESTLVP
jgi:hypothetical protein